MSYTRRNTRPGYRKIAQPEGHNSAQFLEAVWLPCLEVGTPYDQRCCVGSPRRERQYERPAGWYVRRTCACHEGQIVISRCYERQEAAFAGVRLLVEAAMVFDT